MRLHKHGVVKLRADGDDLGQSQGFPTALVVVSDDRTHLLSVSDGRPVIRGLDQKMTRRAALAPVDGPVVPVGFAWDAGVGLFGRSLLPFDDGDNPCGEPEAIEDVRFGPLSGPRAPLEGITILGLPPPSHSLDEDSVAAACVAADGALWLLLDSRRDNALSWALAFVPPGVRTIAAALVVHKATAGAAYARDSVGAVRLMRTEGGVMLLLGATNRDSAIRCELATFAAGAISLQPRSFDLPEGADPRSIDFAAGHAFVFALDRSNIWVRPSSGGSWSSVEGVEGVLEAAEELYVEGDLELCSPWTLPRAVATPDGPGLLVLTARGGSLAARAWAVR